MKHRRKKRRALFIAGTVCAVISVFCVVAVIFGFFNRASTEDFAPKRTATADQSATASEWTQTEYKSPVDFNALKKINKDIYAWIDIPGTDISYPVVQSANDDTFYLNRNSDLEQSANGAIFSEHEYNKTDFSDPVTVLYGHNMKSGAMFGTLQRLYSNENFLKKNNEFIIYLPDKELRYSIFAATSYSNLHMLYFYSFDKAYVFDQFFDELYLSHYMGSIFVDDLQPHFGDKVVVLSTCMNADDSRRYLVMGVCKSKD